MTSPARQNRSPLTGTAATLTLLLVVALEIAGLPLMRAIDAFPDVVYRQFTPFDFWQEFIFNNVMTLGLSVASWFILTRRRIWFGWFLLITSLLLAASDISARYALYTLYINPESALPAATLVGWLQNWLWVPGLAAGTVFILFLFPDGRLPSPRWRTVFRMTVGVVMLVILSNAFLNTRLTGPFLGQIEHEIANPLSLLPANRSADQLVAISSLLLFLMTPIAIASMVARYRGASTVQRQQIKWIVYFTIVGGLIGVADALFTFVIPDLPDYFPVVTGILAGIVWSLLPVVVTIAILRYRLFDIDLIIRRTLQYAVLTAALGLGYFGSVVGLQAMFRQVLGQNSSAAIIISTLAIAALFNPLRQRIHTFIDKRFFRQAYDTQETLDAFNRVMHNEVEIGQIERTLITTVNESLHPTSVSLWLIHDD